MLERIKQTAIRLHDDERGPPEASTVLIAALIMIPLIMLLIAFGKDIAGWLQQKWSSISGQQSAIPTSR